MSSFLLSCHVLLGRVFSRLCVGVSQQVLATCMVYHGISERRLTEYLTLAHFDCCQERYNYYWQLCLPAVRPVVSFDYRNCSIFISLIRLKTVFCGSIIYIAPDWTERWSENNGRETDRSKQKFRTWKWRTKSTAGCEFLGQNTVLTEIRLQW